MTYMPLPIRDLSPIMQILRDNYSGHYLRAGRTILADTWCFGYGDTYLIS